MPQLQAKISATQGASLARFLDLLLDKKLIKKADLAIYREKYSDPVQIFNVLENLEKIPNETVSQVYAQSLGLPYVKPSEIDEKALKIIDKDLARRFGFIPFSIDEKNKTIQVAMTSPERVATLNREVLEALGDKIGYKIELFIAPAASSNLLLDDVSGKITTIENKVEQMSKPQSIDLSDIEVDLGTYKKLPIEICERLKAIVFKTRGSNELDVALANVDQQSMRAFELIEKKMNWEIVVYTALPEQIEKKLAEYKKALEQSEMRDKIVYGEKKDNLQVKEELAHKPKPEPQLSSAMEDPDLIKFLGKAQVAATDIKSYANSEAIPQMMAAILLLAISQRASDVHIEPFEKAVRVRYRIDGELSDIVVMSASLISSIVARVKILAKLKIDEQRVPQDGRFDAKAGEELVDIRVSTLPTVFGEKIVLRLLSKSKKLEKLEDLGLDGLGYDRIIEAMKKPYGVILATGPTGSGKSTTLYSILSQLNHPEINIVTLEDPVEYQIEGINQVQIKPQIGFGFADGLRSVLRQDPNIIMVGEIRDKETAELVTQAALTGHLVLSTLHTNTAAGALPRLYNLSVEPFLISSSINAILGQRLVRRLCSNCKVEIEVPQSVVFETKKEFEKLNLNHPIKFYRGRGCGECKNGFKGRIGIFEVLAMSDAIEDLVAGKKSETDIFTQAVKDGMITMKQDGLIKAVKGLTSADEVIRATTES